MAIRSHLDPTFFIIFLHVNSTEYDQEFRDLVHRLKPAKGTDLQTLFHALRDRQRRTLAHERYHYWQGLRLPFLHLYANLTYRAFFLGVREMAQTDEDWRHWAEFGVIAAGFERLDLQSYMAGNKAGRLVFGAEPISGYEMSLQYSAKEMLECAASIFDYQAACENISEMSDPLQFRRWRKRTPAYLKIFDFFERFLCSEKLTLRVILPLINAAFHTSVPERAMFELLARIWGNFCNPTGAADAFLAQKEPCRWPELFRMWLAELEYDYSYCTTPETLDLNSGAFFYLAPEAILGMSISGAFRHPFLGPLCMEWDRRTPTTPGLEFLLDLPGYVSNPAALEFAFSAEPQLRIIRVFSDRGSDKVFAVGDGLVGPAFQDSFFSKLSPSHFRGFILDSLAAYGAFRRATGAHMAEASRTCYHTTCPYFEANYCNCYPLIPERFDECGFPERLQSWITANRR